MRRFLFLVLVLTTGCALWYPEYEQVQAAQGRRQYLEAKRGDLIARVGTLEALKEFERADEVEARIEALDAELDGVIKDEAKGRATIRSKKRDDWAAATGAVLNILLVSLGAPVLGSLAGRQAASS